MSTLDRLADLAPERVRPLKRVEYERLVSEGLFDDERIELLGGVIVEMSPQDTRHAALVERLSRELGRAITDSFSVRAQLPFAASDDSLPEPDIAVVPRMDYDEAHPDKAALIVEVAHTSLRKDRAIKSRIYSWAGVPEYWVVNVAERQIEVHTGPADGSYAMTVVYRPGETIRVATLADAEIAVSDVIR
jgi:Uma2 family endonuclease